jgi:lipoprotein-anchoring transpeptidase ErfK/SrfK
MAASRFVGSTGQATGWRIYMKAICIVRGLALGIAFSTILGGAAGAIEKRVYDPVTRTFMTYDTDEVRARAGLAPAPAPSRRQQVAAVPRAPAPQVMEQVQYPTPDEKFDRQVVAYDTAEEPGTIVIDTQEKFLYFVLEGGEAIRMGVGVGREGFGWTGTVHVGSMQENPKWFPPAEMVARQPELAKYQTTGMPGGEGNPLGVRALYLNDDKGKDTLYRIHGTIEPNSIGLNVSSGCIRLLNENVTELYGLAKIGAKVVVI